jgi:hypothetical protein
MEGQASATLHLLLSSGLVVILALVGMAWRQSMNRLMRIEKKQGNMMGVLFALATAANNPDVNEALKEALQNGK